MASVTSVRQQRIAGTSAVLGATTEIVIPVSTTRKKVVLKHVRVVRTAGTAANFNPRVVSLTGAAAADIECELTGSATAVANPYDSGNIDRYCWTDEDGNLFLTPTPDAGADNVFDYAIDFVINE